MAYILWAIGIILYVILLSGISETCGCIPELFCVMNRNLLYVFLLANLATGFVNSNMNTIKADNLSARVVLGRLSDLKVCLVPVLPFTIALVQLLILLVDCRGLHGLCLQLWGPD